MNPVLTLSEVRMSTMIAYRYTPGSTTIVKEAIPIPIPAPHEVLLKVKIAGLCHSDLHLLAGEFPLPEEVRLCLHRHGSSSLTGVFSSLRWAMKFVA